MTRNDTRIIHTDGLEEGIRCAMCTNPMANNRGCDGGCDINESMYKRVLDVIKKNILEQEPCEDAINRQAVIDEIEFFQINPQHFDFVSLIDDIKDLPSVKPQKIGHWVRWYEQKEHDLYTENIPHCKCSECGKEYDAHSSLFINYCNKCGAIME